MSRASVLALLVGCLGSGGAWARGGAEPGETPKGGAQRVAVFRLEFEGDVSEAGRELLAQRLVEGLAVARFEVFGGPMVARKASGRIDPRVCRDGSCYPDAARALGVGYLVVGKVAASQKNYDIALELVNGRTGGSIGHKRERCELCGIEEAGEKMGLAASSLRERLEALAQGPSRFVIRSRPAGAAASIDGARVGATPIDTELTPGPHQVRLAAEGYEGSERSFTVVAGIDETLDIDLVPLPEKFPFRAVGWTGVAVGAVAIVGGIVAITADGKEIGCAIADKDAGGHCPYVRDTRVLGAVLVGVGAAAAAGGGLSLYLGSIGGMRRATETAGAGFTAGVSGRF